MFRQGAGIGWGDGRARVSAQTDGADGVAGVGWGGAEWGGWNGVGWGGVGWGGVDGRRTALKKGARTLKPKGAIRRMTLVMSSCT